MSKKQEAFRAIRVFNSHEVCDLGGGTIYLSYHPRDERGCSPAKWLVNGINHSPDPKSHWADYGSKSFIGKMRSPAFGEAKAWASEKYGIKEWARDPFGGWQDAEVLRRVEIKSKEGK